ncbi:ABC transporter ATP-binding protein [Mycolicibacterium sp. S2-37]|uniref:ABC transporter ATP-binding protein n=1 Tax=Mycolicibacterium sp. S2-37 TaxID=2810297 RepID=UPI001A93DE96|nr:ABC transporter ATP-binding protein [Mycolicibacterium sp. S2-37]MBO0681299.1 ABC transporter ATP-binding protein [Mycolicibacterium sp. S2-37]
MIRHLYALIPDRNIILRLGALNAAQSVLQGLLLGSLIPILRALLHDEPDFAAAGPWLLSAAVGLAVYGLLTVIATPIGFAAANDVTEQLRRRLIEHTATLPLGWFTPANKSRLARATTADTTNIGQLAVSIGGPAITAVLTPLTILAVSAAVDWRVTALFAAILPVAFIALRRAGRVASIAEVELEDAAAHIAGRAVEVGQAQPILRAAGQGGTGTARLREALDEHRAAYRRGLRRSTLPDITYTAVVMAGFVALLATAALLLTQQRIDVPDVIALMVLAVRFLEPLGSLSELIGALHAMDNAVTRVETIMNTPALPDRPGGAASPESADIALVGVTFTYPGGSTPALRDVTHTFAAGSTTALVGTSGSGKTTLIRLIARFFDPDAGAVRIGGVDVRELDQTDLLDRISIVFQEVYLFDDTIENNLRIARPGATAEAVAAAARAARVDEIVARLPDGWDTTVGEGGARLSGGERQRVSIARALLKDASVVLIDEAASALDPENARAVSDAIRHLIDDPARTVIVIAHQPATLAVADRVITLERGRIIERGSPDELLAADGMFARLHRRGVAANSWRIARRR